MKRKTLIFLLIFIFIGTGVISAQISQGKFLLGEFSNIQILQNGTPTSMNVGWSSFKTKDDSGSEGNAGRMFSINLIPRFGYFVIDNFAIGMDITLSFSHVNAMDGQYISNKTQIGTGPFIRYYLPISKYLPFVEANYSIGSQRDRSEFNNSGDWYTYKIQQYGFGIGIGFPLGEKVSFDTLLGYQSYISKAKDDNEENERDIVGTIGLKLGLTIIL